MRRPLAVAAVVAAVWLVVASALFVWPHDDGPITGRADAVVSLAGSEARLPVAERLVDDGIAPVLVVSYEPALEEEGSRRVCEPPAEGVVCFRADPASTRGEARAIERLARERGWDDLVVVTSDFHVFRARLVLERCYRGRLRMEDAPSSRLWLPWELVKESAKLALALTLRRGC
ncbi:MAG: YdcF family protein [Pseudomonadota bacterium]